MFSYYSILIDVAGVIYRQRLGSLLLRKIHCVIIKLVNLLNIK